MSSRVLIAVTHLLGAGHLTRAAAIARALADAGCEVTLVSGGRPTAVIREDGFSLVQLPPVQSSAGDFTTLRGPDSAEVSPSYLLTRRDLLLACVAETHPDILVTELFPFGRRSLSDEFMALIDASRRLRPRPLIACSIRDILVAPAKAEKVARAHEVLARCYDAVLVHGDPALVPLEASWPEGRGIAVPVIYTGYVDGEAPPADREPGDEILVSGGSSAAALPLYRAAIEAARRGGSRPWRLLVGRGVAAEDVAALQAVRPDNVTIEPARADFRDLMAGSALFIGQAGYNTVVDLLATRARALLVPFEQGSETEQRLRAEMLQIRELASVLPEAELSDDRLASEVEAALARPRPSAAAISRDGAERTAEILADLAQHRGQAMAGSAS